MAENIKIEEMKVNVSQSMMKELYDYRMKKSCGLVFVEKYVHGNFDKFPPSDTQKLGTWFEYQCTKAVPKNGEIPLPERTAKGELTAAYKRMESQVDNFNKFMTFYNIKILSTQDKWIEDGLEGTLDILALAQSDIKVDGVTIINAGEEFIIDIKSTGLLDDKWHDYGWDLEKLSNKHRIILQPIHYKFLSRLKFKKEYKFLFLLFSTTNDYDFRSILFNTSEEDMEFHKEFIASSVQWLKHYLKKGFEANPDILRCHNCALRMGCKHFAAVPKIQIFQLQNPNNS